MGDPYFDQNLIYLLDQIFSPVHKGGVTEVRLLTAERQLRPFKGKAPQIKLQDYLSLKDYLKNQGVNIELRTLHGKDIPHDRLFYYPDGAINMPPFNSAYGDHCHLSEYTLSNTERDLFEAYWEKASLVPDK